VYLSSHYFFPPLSFPASLSLSPLTSHFLVFRVFLADLYCFSPFLPPFSLLSVPPSVDSILLAPFGLLVSGGSEDDHFIDEALAGMYKMKVLIGTVSKLHEDRSRSFADAKRKADDSQAILQQNKQRAKVSIRRWQNCCEPWTTRFVIIVSRSRTGQIWTIITAEEKFCVRASACPVFAIWYTGRRRVCGLRNGTAASIFAWRARTWERRWRSCLKYF